MTLTEVLWTAVPQTRAPSRERGKENAHEKRREEEKHTEILIWSVMIRVNILGEKGGCLNT